MAASKKIGFSWYRYELWTSIYAHYIPCGTIISHLQITGNIKCVWSLITRFTFKCMGKVHFFHVACAMNSLKNLNSICAKMEFCIHMQSFFKEVKNCPWQVTRMKKIMAKIYDKIGFARSKTAKWVQRLRELVERSKVLRDHCNTFFPLISCDDTQKRHKFYDVRNNLKSLTKRQNLSLSNSPDCKCFTCIHS